MNLREHLEQLALEHRRHQDLESASQDFTFFDKVATNWALLKARLSDRLHYQVNPVGWTSTASHPLIIFFGFTHDDLVVFADWELEEFTVDVYGKRLRLEPNRDALAEIAKQVLLSTVYNMAPMFFGADQMTRQQRLSMWIDNTTIQHHALLLNHEGYPYTKE